MNGIMVHKGLSLYAITTGELEGIPNQRLWDFVGNIPSVTQGKEEKNADSSPTHGFTGHNGLHRWSE